MTTPDQFKGEYEKENRVVMTWDLAGYAKAFETNSDEDVARFVDDYYQLCESIVATRGGTIIKFIGDGCLATFLPEATLDAVGGARELVRAVDDLAKRYQLRLALGVNIHLAVIVEGHFGTGQSRRKDIVGRGVNDTFLLGRGPGIRMSEAAYRQLPNEARAPWTKHEPPAVYHLTSS